MRIQDIANLRLANQQISSSKFTSPKAIVAWMGAMQAQDYAMVKWAVGVRLPDSTDQLVQAAIDNADIVRTHVLRPTWHFVSADDVRWILELTAPRIKAGLKSRHKQLGLTEDILSKSRKVLGKSLRDRNHSTREELIAEFNKANITTDENRASHLFTAAELDGLICSGVTTNGKQTYALLDERVPQSKPLRRDEALASLAKRYFSGHGPATIDDFAWWSGMAIGDAKRALNMVKSDLASEIVSSKTYWFAEISFKEENSAYLLPAFDEFIIGYTDRSATITFENHKRAVSSNGIFHPTVVVNGETIGTWRRTFKKDKIIIEIEYFTPANHATQKLIEAASVRYSGFLGKNIER